ncbi:MAG: selenocysteine-specific translation elongation factor [Actinomycetota bacterium]
MPGELRVIATAGHVDHGKSSLILRLTGIDPDRWAEEKRRGLTIDLGYAWCTLPSGRDVGFVDVPGHERFIANMLAGVGPVPLVLLVVAADEGWKPQSEEHLQILDVLGVTDAVVALTKADLVDEETVRAAGDEVRGRLAGTGLAGAPIVAVSSVTGAGLDELRVALDTLLASATPPGDARARLFVDRVFTIVGAGTVVTGTLSGECVAVGEEVELYPTGRRARVRSLQIHGNARDRACPVSRVAANLVGIERATLQRGDVLGRVGAWRPTTLIEASLRPVRGLDHPVTDRGAFKLYAGAAEVDATVRIYGATPLEPGGEAFARIRLSRPLTLDVFDRFVVREAGRQETVAGGIVLDPWPPARPGRAPQRRLAARAGASREALVDLLVAERGAVEASEVTLLTGTSAAGGGWLVHETVRSAADGALRSALRVHHAANPLDEGMDVEMARRTIGDAMRASHAPRDPGAIEAILEALASAGEIVRTASTVRSSTHRASLAGRSIDVDELMRAIGGEREATPPTVRELQAAGLRRDVIEAAAREGVVVRITPDLVVTPELAARSEAVVRAAGGGITVSAFREALGTTRKYAVPLLEWMDRRGVTRREGDLRYPTG